MLITSDLALVAERLIPGFALRVDGGLIVEAGPLSALRKSDEAVVDLGRRLMLPGTVNAHNHSFQSLLRGFGDDLDFLSWRARSLYRYTPEILAAGKDGVYTGALFAFAEMALHGVTTVCDFFYLNDAGNENAERVIKAALDVGLRVVMARCFYDWDGAPAAYRERPDEASRRFEELHLRYKDHAQVSVQAAPHSLHGASPEMIRAAFAASQQAGTPLHIHLAEERYQVDDSLARFGKRPLHALEAMAPGIVSPSLVAVHGCWFDASERELLAARGASLAYNPGSNMFLGDGITDVVHLDALGARIALGTDGGCSNSRVSIFDEMRTCALLQKVEKLDGQAMRAERAFHFGTRGGGEVLGLPVGRLVAGDCCDLVFADLDDPSLWPEQSIVKNVVYSLSPRAITDVWVEGRAIVRDKKLVQLDLADVQRKVRELTKTWGEN